MHLLKKLFFQRQDKMDLIVLVIFCHLFMMTKFDGLNCKPVKQSDSNLDPDSNEANSDYTRNFRHSSAMPSSVYNDERSARAQHHTDNSQKLNQHFDTATLNRMPQSSQNQTSRKQVAQNDSPKSKFQSENLASPNLERSNNTNQLLGNNFEQDRTIEGSGFGPLPSNRNGKSKFDDTEEGEDDEEDEDYDDEKVPPESGSGHNVNPVAPHKPMNISKEPVKTPADEEIYSPFRPPPSRAQPTTSSPKLATPAPQATTQRASLTTTVIITTTRVPTVGGAKIKVNESKAETDYDYEEEDSDDEDHEEASVFEDNDSNDSEFSISRTNSSTSTQAISNGSIRVPNLNYDNSTNSLSSRPQKESNSINGISSIQPPNKPSVTPSRKTELAPPPTTTTVKPTAVSSTPEQSIPADPHRNGNEDADENDDDDDDADDDEEDEDSEELDDDDDSMEPDTSTELPSGGQNMWDRQDNQQKPNQISAMQPSKADQDGRRIDLLNTSASIATFQTSQVNQYSEQPILNVGPTPVTHSPVESSPSPRPTTTMYDLPDHMTSIFSMEPATMHTTNPSTIMTTFSRPPEARTTLRPPTQSLTTSRPLIPVLVMTTPTSRVSPSIKTTNLVSFDRELQSNNESLTRQIYDKAVEVYQEADKSVRAAIEAVWPTKFDSATLEPLFAQPLFFMFALGGAVIGLVLTMMLVVYIVTYQIQPRDDDISSIY